MGTLARLREIWEAMTRANQIMLVAVLGAVMLAGVGFIYWAGTPDFQTLVSNPSPNDYAGIINQLVNKKVSYRVVDGSIQVPAAQRDELRMALAGQGLLNTGSLGYSALEKAPFGQTQAMEQQTIKRAMEGEMENSIMSLAQVATAHVKYAAGDDSMFVSADRREPSASVLVHLKPGQELSKANRKAIVNMVARAYTGLTTKSVTMVDGEGNLLWDGAQEFSDTVGIEERQSQEKAYKESLGREIQQQLKAVVGPNKSWVIVRAELDFDKKIETRTEVLPGVATTQQSEEESLKGAGQVAPRTPPAGVAANAAGAPANPPTYGTSVDSRTGNYIHNTTTKSTAVGSSKTDTIKAPGEVKSLSVSVLLDKSVSPETVAALEQNVKTFVGADPTTAPTRQVSLQQVEFDKTAIDAEKKAAETSMASERMNRMLGYGIPLALMLVMLIILARGLKKAMPSPQLALQSASGRPLGLAAGRPASGGLDLTVGDAAGKVAVLREGEAIQDTVLGLAQGEQVHTFEVINQNFDADLASVMHLAKSKPETVAALLKSWITEKQR